MTHNLDHIERMMSKYSTDELKNIRFWIDEKLGTELPDKVGSADASADDEKRKYIAQHGDNPNAQQTAQAVPQPVSNEVKDLQNQKALEEHQAKGNNDIENEHGATVGDKQHAKLS